MTSVKIQHHVQTMDDGVVIYFFAKRGIKNSEIQENYHIVRADETRRLNSLTVAM